MRSTAAACTAVAPCSLQVEGPSQAGVKTQPPCSTHRELVTLRPSLSRLACYHRCRR